MSSIFDSPTQRLSGRAPIDLRSDRFSNCAELFLARLSQDAARPLPRLSPLSQEGEIIVLKDLQENGVAGLVKGPPCQGAERVYRVSSLPRS